MKSNLEQLKEIIHKAVPSIMDKEFGCKVVKEKKIYKLYGKHKWADKVVIAISIDKGLIQFAPDTYKILGRDIELSDILIVLEPLHLDFRYYYKDDLHIQFEKDGKLLGIWNLTKTLDNQKPEVISFLLTLLK